MDNPVTRVNLLDPCMRLPLEHRIIPCLSAKAAGRLACTSKIFRDLLYHDLLEHDFYAQLALNNLGPTHPVLLAQVRPRPTLLQVAMSRCERARVNMKAGQYTQSRVPASIVGLESIKFSSDCSMAAALCNRGDELRVYSLPAFALIMVKQFGLGLPHGLVESISGFQWSRTSKSIFLLLAGHGFRRAPLCLEICIATQSQASSLQLDGGGALLSAFAEHVAFRGPVFLPESLQPIAQQLSTAALQQAQRQELLVWGTRCGTELLRIGLSKTNEFRWHPRNADLLAELSPRPTSLTLYSVSQGAALFRHQLPVSECKLSQHDWPADRAIVHGRDDDGDETMALVGNASYALYSSSDKESWTVRAFSPNGLYIAVCSHAMDAPGLMTKLEVYEVRSGRLRFSQPSQDIAQPGNRLGWRATWAGNSQLVYFTLVTRGRSPLPPSERMSRHLAKQGLYVVSVSRWQGLFPAIPVSACVEPVRCLPDCCKIFLSTGPSACRTEYSLVSFDD